MSNRPHTVYAVFAESSRLHNRKLTINQPNRANGTIWQQVTAQLADGELPKLIGVLDSTRTAWID